MSSFIQHELTHLDQCGDLLPGIEIQTDQLSPGPLSFLIRSQSTLSGSLIEVAANQVIQYRAHPEPDHYYFTPVSVANQRSRFRGRIANAGVVNVLHPDDRINHITAAGSLTTILVVHREYVDALARSALGRDLAESPLSICVDVGLREGLSFHERIHRAIKEPQVEDADQLIEELVLAVLKARATCLLSKRDERNLQLFHAACQIASEDACLVSLQQLTTWLDCSERTLNYAFHRFCAVSPKRYLRAIRLNQLRRALRDASPADTVIGIVSRYRIEYSGVFAAEYKKYFGESPSETLNASRRNASFPECSVNV